MSKGSCRASRNNEVEFGNVLHSFSATPMSSPPTGERHETCHFPFWQGSALPELRAIQAMPTPARHPSRYRFVPFDLPALTISPKRSPLSHVCPPLKRYRKSLPRGKGKRRRSSAIPPEQRLPSDFLALRLLSPCHGQALAHCPSHP